MQDETILQKLNRIEQKLSEQVMLSKDMLNPEEAALYLNVSRSYLYKMTSRRMIPHYCPNGKKLFFKRADLIEFQQKNRKSSRIELEAEALSFTTKSNKR